ncbi:hypothetical protein L7F22_062413 [Adiantum nelumboides]|nr:hypothetical protein [Adiantum nelumboides]
MLKVSVKWQKEVFPSVEIDTTQTPYVFKCQLFDLTGVPPERQKIMLKGGILKDDGDWSKLGIKEGQRLLMMGSAGEIPQAPEKGPVFVEDLPEEEQEHAALGHTAGLLNLGNTCYMSSTVQCLHSVPELKHALKKYSGGGANELDTSSHLLTLATRELFNELDTSHRAVAPVLFWTVLRGKYPQFAQQTNTGMYMQQDAEECWTQLLYTLSQRLGVTDDDRTPAPSLKELFSIELASRISCSESVEEATEKERVYSLKCHISQDVNHLLDGLKLAMKSELEKVSPALQRSCVYIKQTQISDLPLYTTVQFVRFFWKRESNQKAKILRRVEYPVLLDVFDLCSEELQEKLKAPRQILRAEDDAKAGLGKSKEMDVDGPGASSAAADCAGSGQTPAHPKVTGYYDLVAVLTHKGRSADSGHYVAWVKQESGKWIQFDDHQPIPQKEEDITRLSGGGDWHMAYILLYKARVVSC